MRTSNIGVQRCMHCGRLYGGPYCGYCGRRPSGAAPDTSPEAVSLRTRWTLLIDRHIRSRYNGECPVRLDVTDPPVMTGINVNIHIPGQARLVLINARQMHSIGNPAVEEEVLDEVMNAVYTLLEDLEDE